MSEAILIHRYSDFNSSHKQTNFDDHTVLGIHTNYPDHGKIKQKSVSFAALMKLFKYMYQKLKCSKYPISLRHLQLAIRNNEELNKLLSGVTIAQGGVFSNIQAVLPKKTQKAKQ